MLFPTMRAAGELHVDQASEHFHLHRLSIHLLQPRRVRVSHDDTSAERDV